MYKSRKPSSSIFEMQQKDNKIVNRFLNSIENRYCNNYCLYDIALILAAVLLLLLIIEANQLHQFA